LRNMLGWLVSNSLQTKWNESLVISFTGLLWELHRRTEENSENPHLW
jgi:hypothetical protein